MWPDNRLLRTVNIEHPIVQAPMAGAGGLEMAIAVSEAGGLGSLACAALDPSALRDLLASAGNRTGRTLNINFFAHPPAGQDKAADTAWAKGLAPFYERFGLHPQQTLDVGSIHPFDDERCQVIETFKPAVVSFHFGLPDADLVARVKAMGAQVMSTATSVEEARWLEQHGCDIIIAQGHEAGGHRGMFLSNDVATQMGGMALVPQIADAVQIPVIAAGGIADGRGISAAFALGASGVQIGTAYLFTKEATLSKTYRRALQSAGSQPTALTNVFSGRPSRCLVNAMMREKGPMAADAPEFPKGFAAMARLAKAAESTGCRDFSAHYCGQAAALGRATTAAALTRELAADASRCFKRLGTD
jgi:nitronate monooxygenase